MSDNFTFNGRATLNLPIEESTEQATIPVVDLDLVSGGNDLQLVALHGGTRTVRIEWTAISGSFVHIAPVPGGQADPGTPTSLAVSPNAVYTYLLDAEGLDSGWGKTPRYTGNWEDLEGGVRFVPMHATIVATEEEKATARENIGVLTATFSSPGLLSPSEQYFYLVDGVFSPKEATQDSYGVVRIYSGAVEDHGEYGMHAVTKTYVDGRIDTLINTLDQNIPTTGRGTRGLVSIKDEEAPSIILEGGGTISVHKVSDVKVLSSDGDNERGIVRVAGVNASLYNPDTQSTWAAPVGLVQNLIDAAIPDILATDAKAGTVALTDTVIRDTRPGAVPGAVTVTDATWDADDKACQKGIVRLQNTMSMLEDEEHASQWSHEDDAMDPVATTPAAVRQYVYTYFHNKVIEGGIVPVATMDTLGIVRGSDSVQISRDLLTEGQMTVPKATEGVYGIVKVLGTEGDRRETGQTVPTVAKADALVVEKINSIITSAYGRTDQTHPVTGSAIAEAIDTENAGMDRFGTVKISSVSTDDTVTLLPIRMVDDPDDPRDGRIFAEYVADEPIQVNPATKGQYGTVKLGSDRIVNPDLPDAPIFPVARDRDGHMYALASSDASRLWPVASLDRTGVVKAADVQASFSNLGSAAKVTVVSESGDHQGEMYVKPAGIDRYGSVKLQSSSGGWDAGTFTDDGRIILTRTSFRAVMNENFMAGVGSSGTPGFVRRVEFDLTSPSSSYNLASSCPVGYDAQGRLVADVGAIQAATYSTAGVVKLGSSAVLDATRAPYSPVCADNAGHMGVSIADISSKMTFNFLSNNAGTGTAGTYAVGNTVVNSSNCAVLGSEAGVGSSSDYSVVVGSSSNATGQDSVLVGYSTSAYGGFSTVVGSRAGATGINTASGASVAVGYSARVYGGYSVAVGAGASVGSSGNLDSIGSMAVGYYAKTEGEDAVSVGRLSNTTSYSVAVGAIASDAPGDGWTPSEYTVSVGYNALADGTGATVVGPLARAGVEGTAIGHSTVVTGRNSIAVGTALEVSSVDSVAIGSNFKLVTDNIVKIGTGKTFAYLIMVDPDGGDEQDEEKPYLAFTREVTTGVTPEISGKAISLEALFDKLEELGCPVHRVTDNDGDITIIKSNASA